MDTRIALKYFGPAVEDGRMDVYQAAANMIAFSDFVVLAARHAYGGAIVARAEVAGIARGSFITDMVFHVAGASATVFATVDARTLWSVVKDAFTLWKHLKGAPPAKVEQRGQQVAVTNNNGQMINVNIGALNVAFSDKGAEAVEKFVRSALEQQGMDGVSLVSAKKVIAEVKQDEAHFFVPVAPMHTIADSTVPMALILEGPVFKDGNKWRFSDGQQSFHASIEDREFLSRVDRGERFGKGDVLYVDIRLNQQQSGMKLNMERTIVRVKDIKRGPVQGDWITGS
jgi:hypothetical protein